ncbi:hypothetical protein N786_01825 [Bacillus amyloliquefaciens UASWS BA1]|nr:hypothetical protein N786_01825 [Bacillus amyloliquefaciens UASWS BA1]
MYDPAFFGTETLYFFFKNNIKMISCPMSLK